MKLWLITQDENKGYDTHDSAVVVAASEEDAKQIDVGGWDWKETRYTSWASSPDKVEARCLGDATPGLERGVVLSSFNAG